MGTPGADVMNPANILTTRALGWKLLASAVLWCLPWALFKIHDWRVCRFANLTDQETP